MLGSDASRTLAAAGHRVTDVDAYCRQPSAAALDRVPTRLDWVLHFAARTSVMQSLGDGDAVRQHNLAATQAAIDIAVTRGAALLYLSSYVYGVPQYNPIDELHPVAAVNPYMASKLDGERMAQAACRSAGLPLIVLRPFSVYGGQRQPGRLISDLLAALAQGDALQIHDAEPQRDHLFVADFSRLVTAVVAQRAVDGTFNVGSGVAHSNLAVAELVRTLAGDARAVLVLGKPRPGDVSVCVADTRSVRETFGWTPQWSLRDGLAHLIAAARTGPSG